MIQPRITYPLTHATHAEAVRALPVRLPSPVGALGCGVARPVLAGTAAARAGVIGETGVLNEN